MPGLGKSSHAKTHVFLGVLPEGGDLLPKLYWTFLQVPIYQHKFIVFVYVVSTLSFDHISTYDKCNFLILFVMTWIEALRSNYVFFLPPLPGQCQKENICFREVVP